MVINVAKMSKEQLKRRKAELGKQAREELAKTEVMRFRLAPADILKLCELAEQKRQHVGAMVREWVLERAEAESQMADNAFDLGITSGICKEPNSPEYANRDLRIILQRVENLEKEVKRLSKRQ
jgi:hypothetical protein